MNQQIIHISFVEQFEPGDPPPSGYVAWHEWAAVQAKAGLRQQQCGLCALWKFPQELSARVISTEAETAGGQIVKLKSPVCLACDRKETSQ